MRLILRSISGQAYLEKFLTKLNDEVDDVLPEVIQKRRIKRYRELVISGNPESPFIMPALGSG